MPYFFFQYVILRDFECEYSLDFLNMQDYQLREQPDERFYEILSLLRNMANNLNQMARTYNRYQGYMREDKFTPLLNQIQDFVLNSVSFLDGKRFCNTKKDYATIRKTSDRLCEDYGLSVLKKEY